MQSIAQQRVQVRIQGANRKTNNQVAKRKQSKPVQYVVPGEHIYKITYVRKHAKNKVSLLPSGQKNNSETLRCEKRGFPQNQKMKQKNTSKCEKQVSQAQVSRVYCLLHVCIFIEAFAHA